MKIDYSEYDIDNTARAVFIMNESARELYDSWEELREFMLSTVSQYADNEKVTSFSTGGFHLSFSRDDRSVYVTPSVQAYTALRYAEQVTLRLIRISDIALSQNIQVGE